MSAMKCPKCGGRLVYWGATGALLKCSQCKFCWGNEELWQELIRTRKELDIAVDALKLFCGEDVSYYSQSKIDARDARTALEQITVLEQKDVK